MPVARIWSAVFKLQAPAAPLAWPVSHLLQTARAGLLLLDDDDDGGGGDVEKLLLRRWESWVLSTWASFVSPLDVEVPCMQSTEMESAVRFQTESAPARGAM